MSWNKPLLLRQYYIHARQVQRSSSQVLVQQATRSHRSTKNFLAEFGINASRDHDAVWDILEHDRAIMNKLRRRAMSGKSFPDAFALIHRELLELCQRGESLDCIQTSTRYLEDITDLANIFMRCQFLQIIKTDHEYDGEPWYCDVRRWADALLLLLAQVCEYTHGVQ